jgi:Holliday junction resolvase RusA-like endonuclease
LERKKKYIEINPIGKPRMVRSDAWKRRPAVVRYWNFKDALSGHLNAFKDPCVIGLKFYIPMPKSWSKKKKAEMCYCPHKSKPDLDNLVKAFQDCLYKDDSCVHTYLRTQKVWAYHGAIEFTWED